MQLHREQRDDVVGLLVYESSEQPKMLRDMKAPNMSATRKNAVHQQCSTLAPG